MVIICGRDKYFLNVYVKMQITCVTPSLQVRRFSFLHEQLDPVSLPRPVTFLLIRQSSEGALRCCFVYTQCKKTATQPLKAH